MWSIYFIALLISNNRWRNSIVCLWKKERSWTYSVWHHIFVSPGKGQLCSLIWHESNDTSCVKFNFGLICSPFAFKWNTLLSKLSHHVISNEGLRHIYFSGELFCYHLSLWNDKEPLLTHRLDFISGYLPYSRN